ncbi:hypothetical protein O181_131561 [Austropuccinia psidii MF-1]|uniref:Uncharacterized protein n=1 Tax=Austropuccinia psidii MF-1 TaxID=1389203 RepID=A0A9Q3QAF3_9BASI|nr:hypothetical protein [Austropuccinia psidii MF-1]
MINWFKNQIILSTDQKKELKMTPALEKEDPVASAAPSQLYKCPKTSPKNLRRRREVLGTIKEREKTLPTRVKVSQIGTFSHGQCVQYGQNFYGIHSQGAGKDKQDFSIQIMDEIKHIG